IAAHCLDVLAQGNFGSDFFPPFIGKGYASCVKAQNEKCKHTDYRCTPVSWSICFIPHAGECTRSFDIWGACHMLQILILIAALLPIQFDTMLTVQYGGKKYEFHVSQDELQKTPAWPVNQENPPLAARRAIDVATKQLATLLPNGKDWRLHAVTLREIDN